MRTRPPLFPIPTRALRGVLAVSVLLLVSGLLGPLGAQEGTAVDAERIGLFARAHAEISEIRLAFQAERAQNHEAEAIAELRERVNRRIAGVLREHGLPRQEYERLIFLVSADEEARARFEATRRENPGQGPSAEVTGREPPPAPVAADEAGAPAPEGRVTRGGAAGGERGPPEGDSGDATDVSPEGGRADEAAPQAPVPEITPTMMAEGEELFRGSGACFTCHGEDGGGGPLAPDLTDDVWLHIDGSYRAIVDLVTEGVPEPVESGIPMPPRGGSGITPEQIRAVAAYVAGLSGGS